MSTGSSGRTLPAHRAETTPQRLGIIFQPSLQQKADAQKGPDVNPLDYELCSVLEDKTCTRPHKSLLGLRKSVAKEGSYKGISGGSAYINNIMDRALEGPHQRQRQPLRTNVSLKPHAFSC